jgi:GT2 family glycosyltransferase/SAM-dependent methyltransferase
VADSVRHDAPDLYGQAYYASYADSPYQWGEPHWHRFFAQVADAIMAEIAPVTVLDAGCAIGFLVAALRERGVDAYGIDISQYAIGQVPTELRPFCSVGSITDNLDRDYDLIVCIEVLEHLPPDLAPVAVANLARHAGSVLFSSSPSDFREATHINVQPTEYWVGLFAQHGLFRNVDLDASFVSPQAIHFHRGVKTAAGVARAYERWHWRNLSELRELRAARLQAEEEIATLRASERSARATLKQLSQSRTFRYTAPARKLYARIRRGPDPGRSEYQAWIDEFDTVDDRARAAMQAEIATFSRQPLLSVLMPVRNPPELLLRRAINSLRSQLYDNWELCIADDDSTMPHVRRVLRDLAASDPRIKVAFRETRGHIAAASNTALEACTGEYAILLDQDDELAEQAFYVVVREINRNPPVVLLYSDEDKIDMKGHRFEPYFKPDWNPDLLRSQNYVSHLGVYRTSVVREVGGFREGFSGSQDYDLVLRVSERCRSEEIAHIPSVLYHWRVTTGSAAADAAAKPYAVEAARRAIVEHLGRTGRRAEVLPAAGVHTRVRYAVPKPEPPVSVIVPTRDGPFLETCLESVRKMTSYERYELLVVDNQSQAPGTRAYLASLEEAGSARVLRYDAEFSHSAINNFAARDAKGEVLCLLNDDVEVLAPDWLREMVSHALRPEVGAVGAKLLYADRTVQHAGIVLGLGGVAGHIYRGIHADDLGYMSRAALIQSYSAVTGACLAVRRAVYEEAGGLDEEGLPDLFNDVDFCLRLREAGYWNVWTPYAVLIHHESVTRHITSEERNERGKMGQWIKEFERRWGPHLQTDPAHSPNLSLRSEGSGLARPPRIDWPWTRSARR